jgi:hypothetical protein
MKSFTLLLATLLIFSSQSFAQNRISQFAATCVNIETLADLLKEFQEDPAMTMISIRESNGDFVNNSLVLFINYETKTWTLAEQTQRNRYCVIATGENIKPYINK